MNINLSLCNDNYVFVSSFNVNRLRTHFNQVAREISIKSYDIVCIGETFLKPDNPNDDVNIYGYNLIRSDRVVRDGGGVAIYLKSHLSYRILHSNTFIQNSEYLIVEVNMYNEKLLVGVIYRPPKSSHPSEFFKLLSDLLPSFKHVIITGDLNANMNSSNYYSKPIYSFINNNALHLIPSGNTCHSYNADTWLDIFIVSDETQIISFCKSICPLYERHDTLELKYRLKKPIPTRNLPKRRQFKNFNPTTFNSKFHKKMSNLHINESINHQCENFNHAFLSSLNDTAPLVNFKVGPRRKPWVNLDLRKLIESRNRIYI